MGESGAGRDGGERRGTQKVPVEKGEPPAGGGWSQKNWGFMTTGDAQKRQKGLACGKGRKQHSFGPKNSATGKKNKRSGNVRRLQGIQHKFKKKRMRKHRLQSLSGGGKKGEGGRWNQKRRAGAS